MFTLLEEIEGFEALFFNYFEIYDLSYDLLLLLFGVVASYLWRGLLAGDFDFYFMLNSESLGECFGDTPRDTEVTFNFFYIIGSFFKVFFKYLTMLERISSSFERLEGLKFSTVG